MSGVERAQRGARSGCESLFENARKEIKIDASQKKIIAIDLTVVTKGRSSIHGRRLKSGSLDMSRCLRRRESLVLGIIVLALSGAAPAAGAEPFRGGHSERERSETREKTSLEESLEGHQVVARSCKKPRGFRRVTMKGGTKFAQAGEVFAFNKREVRLGRCEEVEIVLENTDNVRHALMLPSLNPMFILEFTGPGIQTARFVTPDEDITLEFHCHVPTHEDLGMQGVFIIGKGGAPKVEQKLAQKNLYDGLGIVVAVQPRKSRIVVDHEEIKDFMAPMVMSYLVKPETLLQGLNKGDKIRFTIDADQRAIVNITPLTFRGEGTVILADVRKSQIVVDHKEIPGFMAAMIMGYPVKPAKLLQGLEPGEKIRFTIDADQKAIVNITRIEK